MVPNVTDDLWMDGIAPCECEIYLPNYTVVYRVFNVVLMMIMMPCVAILGIIGNVINASVYLRLQATKDDTVYLTALSCSDLIIDITGISLFALHSAKEYSLLLTRFTPWIVRYTLPIASGAQTCSVYFTVLAAFQLYLKSCWPSRLHDVLCGRSQHVAILGVTIYSVAYNLLKMLELEASVCWSSIHHAVIGELCPTSFRAVINTVYNVYLQTLLMSVIPFVLLAFLATFIIKAAKKRSLSVPIHNALASINRGHNRLFRKTSSVRQLQVCVQAETPGSGTEMALIGVIIMFLLCAIPGLLVNMLETFFDPDQMLLNYLADVTNFLVVMSASVNFYIYLKFDDAFRAEYNRMRFISRTVRRKHTNTIVYNLSSVAGHRKNTVTMNPRLTRTTSAKTASEQRNRTNLELSSTNSDPCISASTYHIMLQMQQQDGTLV